MDPEKLEFGGGQVASVEADFDEFLNSALIKQTEVIGIREGNIIDCWVPTELIDHEEVPVKEEWALSLATEMQEVANDKGGTGQLAPIILGMIPGESKLKIMDGFHRDKALIINGEEKVYAAVQLTDWDGLYDVRIFTAKDHAHVRFSRVVQWIKEVWAYSGIEDKMSIETAIMLYRFDTNGSKLGLDQYDVLAAKKWVARKEKQWDMASMTIHSHLKVADNVDPQLIHATREKKKSDKLEAPTQAILKVFAEEIPDQFDIQNLVMEKAMQYNLPGPQVKTICKLVTGKKKTEATKFLKEFDWNNLNPSYGKSQQTALRRAHDVRHKGPQILAEPEWTIQSITRRARLSISRNEEVTPEMAKKIEETIDRANSLLGEIGKLTLALDDLLPKKGNKKSEESPKNSAGTSGMIEISEEATAIEEPSGPRQDILDFLSGTTGIDSVKSFNPKQLTECFRAIDSSKTQPEAWRKRFVEIQNANNSGQLK